MIVEALAKLADLVIRALKGILRFIEELIPLVLKVLFGLSPFIVSIFAAKRLVGADAAWIVLGLGILTIILGVVWAHKEGITGEHLDPRTVIIVAVADLLLLASAIWGPAILTGSISMVQSFAADVPTAEPTINRDGIKEDRFIEALKEGISKDDPRLVSRACESLGSIDSKNGLTQILRALEVYYPDASRSPSINASYQASSSCIGALQKIGMAEACPLLFDIQLKQPALAESAEEAANAFCN